MGDVEGISRNSAVKQSLTEQTSVVPVCSLIRLGPGASSAPPNASARQRGAARDVVGPDQESRGAAV